MSQPDGTMVVVDDREPIELVCRDQRLERGARLVVRGWPLTVAGLLGNADATSHRFSRGGEPFLAVSSEVTDGAWTLDAVLAGPRVRTRSRYAAVPVHALIRAGFELIPTFGAPHCSIVLSAYTPEEAERLLVVLGPVRQNPYHVRRVP